MDSVVILPKRIATEIAKDLIRLDKAEDLIKLLEENLAVEVAKVEAHKQVSFNQEEIIANQRLQISALKEQLEVKDDQTEHWKKMYKKQKRQKILVGAIGLGLIVLFGAL